MKIKSDDYTRELTVDGVTYEVDPPIPPGEWNIDEDKIRYVKPPNSIMAAISRRYSKDDN